MLFSAIELAINTWPRCAKSKGKSEHIVYSLTMLYLSIYIIDIRRT